ncbi:MAG: lipoprotein insertase outer membrane protein LolB [Marinobacter sp.]|nr:lipoprotein insertase outer membrane protein LolB [Marinobacter sp.]
MSNLKFSVALLACLLLSACAIKPPDPLPDGLTEQPPRHWAETTLALMALTHWELQGKLAVRQPGDSASASVNRWTQQNEHYELLLSSAVLGMGRTELKGVPGFISLTLPNGETYHSNDPEALILAATGWQLPIDSLTWWVKGLPSPDGDYRLLFDDEDRLTVIRQHGWEIRIDRWRQFITDKPALPARLTALKDDRMVRLAITDWRKEP